MSTTTADVVKSTALAECEAVIERGMTAFIEVGNALLRIRDERLYRQEYRDFETYCQERWAISRPQAYRLIDAAGVMDRLSPIGDVPLPANESQARELVGLPTETAAQVMQEAHAVTNGKPTAVVIKEVRRRIEPPPVEPGPFVPSNGHVIGTRTLYGTILADPPWNYVATSKAQKLRGYSDQHYDPLTTDDLCALPVGDLAHDESVLLLWTTMPFLPDALRVIDAWGFDYVTAISWIKADPTTGGMRYGVGYWFRGAAELYLVARRKKSYRSQFMGLVSPGLQHSRKPESVYDIVEATYPKPYLELFARQPRDGWMSLGNELGEDGQPCDPEDGLDIRESLGLLL